ncbi:Proteasome subunit beta type-7 [Bonamia ostreae]|uniref:proteasome endopeptidase complex n=1 Tax=Bonamia ostreae TaxID=126728 RepID=A0ABV2AF79_9EUKA
MSFNYSKNKSIGFENVNRNKKFEKELNAKPQIRKTGTTICGAVFKNGVILGSDTRATSSSVVANKETVKIEYLADSIACAGAGTSADCSNVRKIMCSKLELLKMATKTQPRVAAAKRLIQRHLFEYQGYVSAYLIVGGADFTGGHLYDISATGAVFKVPFIADGSGCLAAMSMLEAGFRDDMEELEAIELVCKAVKAGINNDLGSGSNVDIHVLTTDGAKVLKGYFRTESGTVEIDSPVIPVGSTRVLGNEEILRESAVAMAD